MRNDGFYIVKIDGGWTVGEWDGWDWSVVGDEDMYSDEDLDVIGEQITMPAAPEGGE